MANLIQDDKGNWSSGRIVFLFSVVIMIWMIRLWNKSYLLEMVKDEPNYEGLAILFEKMVVLFGLVVFLKALSKFAENIPKFRIRKKDGNTKTNC
jgi:hypothetical protein